MGPSMRMISLCFPALISISIEHSRSQSKDWNISRFLLKYGIFVLIDAWVSMAMVAYLFGKLGSSIDAFDRFTFFVKYNAISVMVAIALPYMEELIRTYIAVTFTVRTNDDENK